MTSPRIVRQSQVIQSLLFFFFFLIALSVPEIDAVPINNLLVSAIKTDSITLNWDSTEAYTGWVEYGTTSAYGNSAAAAGLEYFSEVGLSGLAAGTLYNFRIHSINHLGQETVSPANTFTTRTQAEVETAIRAARTDGGLPKIYYVKTDGDDAADGLSLATAWQSPANAVSKADAGDTIYLLAGTWTDECIKFAKSGIDIAPITVAGGYGGGQTVLDSVLNTPIAFVASSKNYFNIQDLTIRHYSYGAVFYQTARVNMTRVTLENLFGDGVWCRTYSRYVHFNQVVIDHTGSDGAGYHGIHSHGIGGVDNDPLSPVMDHIRFTACRITHACHNGIDLHYNNHYVTIAGCTFDYVTNMAGVFSHSHNNRYIMVRACTFQSENTRGLWFQGTDDSFIYRNSFIRSGTTALYILRGGPPEPGCHNIIVKDNVFTNSPPENIDIGIGNQGLLSAPGDTDCVSDLLFIGNSISSKVTFNYPFTESGIKNVYFLNPPDNSMKYEMLVFPVAATFVQFTNNRVFSENSSNEPVYSVGQSDLSLAGLTRATYTLQTYPMTARPVSGTAKILVNQFDASLPAGQVLVNFDAEMVSAARVDFVVGQLQAGVNYLVQRDGVDYHVVKANANQCLAFFNAEGSSRNFTIMETTQTADVDTPADVTIVDPQFSSPLPPRNLIATARNQKVSLSWNSPLQNGSSPIAHYNIYRGNLSGGESLLKQSNTSQTFVDSNIRQGVTYYYKVSAVNAAGESGLSAETSAVGIYHPGAEDRVWVYPNPYVKGKSLDHQVIFSNLPQTATIRVYALSGALLTTLEYSAKTSGEQTEWDVANMASGIYLYTVTYPGGLQKGKVCIVK